MSSSPPSFRGPFRTGEEVRRSYATASGPFSLRPSAVAVPRDVDDVQVLVRWARNEGRSLVPRGSGTGMPGGNVGEGVVVDLATSFREIGAVDRDRRRIRVGAGAVAAEVAHRAREAGLFLPALPSSAERCSIGGMAANNAAGARSFKYGATRDWVRALEVVLADGRAVRLSADRDAPDPFAGLYRALAPRRSELSGRWPRVRKNASGYALDRFLPSGDPTQLLVGSEGTLGLITGVTLELAPRPEARGLALLSVAEPDQLPLAVRAAREAEASACEFFGRRFIETAGLEEDPRVGDLARTAYSLLLVEVDGSPAAVDEGMERIRSLAGSLGSDVRGARSADERSRLWRIRHAASPVIERAADRGLVSMQFIEDSVVPPGRLPDYLRGLERILRDADTDAVVFGHAGDGNVHVNPLVDVGRPEWRRRVRRILDATAELVAELGGTLSGEHGDGRVRAPYLSAIWPRACVRSFREIKETLDPEGVLNPGVILPAAGQDALAGLHEGPGTP